MILTNAIYDLEDAKTLFEVEKQKDQSDRVYNNTCYHLQQCIEKCLKYILEKNGVQYQHIHDINDLCWEVDQLNIDNTINNLIGRIFVNATAYTSWETRSRYFGTFRESESNVEDAFEICKELMNYCNNIPN